MDGYQRVVWAEGVFLGQQHFQVWEQCQHRELAVRQAVARPQGWGVIDAAIAPEPLARGEVRLQSARLLLPDGRLVLYTPHEDSLTLTLPEGGERVEVFAGLPRNDAAHGIAGYRGHPAGSAWQVDYREVPDQHDPTRLREVGLARPNLVLVRGDEPRDQVEAVKLLELVRDADGGWCRDDAFVPPVCRVGAAEALMAILRRIEERLAARIRVLDERRARLGSVSDFGPSDLSEFLLLRELRPARVALRHYLDSGDAHPEVVYLEIARLVAALRAFHPEAGDAAVPPYAHEALGSVFADCERALGGMLSDALPSRMAGVTLTRETEALRVATGLSPTMLERATLFLAVRHDADDPAWVTAFARQIKIGAREDIEMILSSALQGVPVVHVQRPPNRLPIKSGYEYFRIEPSGDFWQRVLEHESLALFMPRDFIAASVDVLTVEE